MSTFYGGDQLASITTLTYVVDGVVSNRVEYTVPAGHVAYLQLISVSSAGGTGGSGSYTTEYNGEVAETGDYTSLVGNSYPFSHPMGGVAKMYDEGAQIRSTTNITPAHTVKWMIYLYKKP